MHQSEFWRWGLRFDAILMGLLALPFFFVKVLPYKVDFDLLDQYDTEGKIKIQVESDQRTAEPDDNHSLSQPEDLAEETFSIMLGRFLKQVLNLIVEMKDETKEDDESEKKRNAKIRWASTNSSIYRKAQELYFKRARIIALPYFLAMVATMLLYHGMEVAIPGWLYNYSVFGIDLSMNDSLHIFLSFWSGFFAGRLFDFIASLFFIFRPHFMLLLSSFSAIILFCLLIIVHAYPMGVFALIIFGVGLFMSLVQHSIMKINANRYSDSTSLLCLLMA